MQKLDKNRRIIIVWYYKQILNNKESLIKQVTHCEMHCRILNVTVI